MKLICISLLILAEFIGTPVTATSDLIFVTDLLNSTIWTGPIATLDLVKIPLRNIGTPVAVDFDPVEQKLYWTDVLTKSISRAFRDGSAQETLLSYLGVPDGIALDVKNRHMYWTDTGTNKIERANLDGSGRITIVQDQFDEPRAIVIDSTNERMFWTDWGANPKIERANLDGSERVTLVNTSIHLPNGIVIDYAAQRLYWCDAGLNKIESSDVNGEDRKPVVSVSSLDIHPFDLGVYNDVIYWSDWALTKLVKMNKYLLGGPEAVGPAVFARAGGLHVYAAAATDGCNENPCINNGQCSEEVNHFLCDCHSTGYEGPTCAADINECEQQSSTVCDENAECINTIGSFTCECTAGYFGAGNTYCIEINECAPNNPCENNGECTDRINDFDCTCSVGYTGDHCEIEINECVPFKPCQNDGECTDTINGFDCTCAVGYTGEHCEIAATDGCNENPCINNGQCSEEVNHFLCDCHSTGYEGPTCAADINECEQQSSTVCDENAECINTIGSFTCECTAGYFGAGNTYCIEINECAPNNPCENNGECTDRINDFDCTCSVGYTGDHCEIATSTECHHPGTLTNGFVISDTTGDTYPPGRKVDFFCKDGYKLMGSKKAFCLLDISWSSENPVCIEENGGIDIPVVYGGGVGGGILILALIIILGLVCRKTRRHPPHGDSNQQNVTVQYTTNPRPVPKDDGIYNTAYDDASSPYTTRVPVAVPPPSHYQMPSPIYEDVAGRYSDQNPPAYIDIINDQPNDTSPNGTDDNYTIMGQIKYQ